MALDKNVEYLTTKEMHYEFLNSTEELLDKLYNEKASYISGKKVLCEQLNRYRDYVSLTTDLDIENLKEGLTKEQINLIYFKKLIGIEDKSEIVTSILHNIVLADKEIANIDKKYNEINGQNVSYKDYTFIVKEFNKAIIEEIIRGYTFNPGFFISDIRIKKKRRTSKRINWSESNKIREQLIKEGKTPYNKDTAPNGDKWFIYYVDDYAYWYYWNKASCKIPNKIYYSFIPTKGDVSNITKLHEFIRSTGDPHLIYKEDNE